MQGFKNCLKDLNNYSNPYQSYSVNCREQVFTLAVKHDSRDIIEAILEYEKQQNEKPEARVKLPSVSLDFMATGVPSKLQFYFPIR